MCRGGNRAACDVGGGNDGRGVTRSDAKRANGSLRHHHQPMANTGAAGMGLQGRGGGDRNRKLMPRNRQSMRRVWQATRKVPGSVNTERCFGPSPESYASAVRAVGSQRAAQELVSGHSVVDDVAVAGRDLVRLRPSATDKLELAVADNPPEAGLDLRRLLRPPQLDPLNLGPYKPVARVRSELFCHGAQDVVHARVVVPKDCTPPPDVVVRVRQHEDVKRPFPRRHRWRWRGIPAAGRVGRA